LRLPRLPACGESRGCFLILGDTAGAAVGHDREVSRQRVLILAAPHVYATALAVCLALDDTCEVVVPDIAAGEVPTCGHYDVMVTTGDAGDFDGVAAEIVVTLPALSWDEPVRVSVGGVTESVLIDRDRSMVHLVGLVRRYVASQRSPRSCRASAGS
jgi:hypothetical protein